jgi:preprotein translocase SecE subunit
MKKFAKYVRESNAEMKNVRWPGRKQTLVFTASVVVVSFAIAYYLGLFDFIFTTLLDMAL